MEQLFEFINNHLYLWVGLVVILVMIIKAEIDSRSNPAIHLSPMNAIRLINDNDDALIIDVRESSDFGKGHIRGATNLPLTSFKDKLDKISPDKNAVILAYCTSGASSSKACRLLGKSGFTNVHNIAGGLNAWVEAKLPVTAK